MKKFKNDKVDEDSADKVATTTTNSSTPTGDGSSLPRALMTVKRSLESIPIKEIKRFELIPDFVTPTSAEHPIIVKTPLENSCIDGWNLIEEAIANGEEEIVCEIDEMEVHSDAEICLRKAGMRSLTRGGKYIYPEMVRNARDVKSFLMSSKEDLRRHGHGGKRFGEDFTNNREENIVYVLCLRLGKDDTTINNYISHSNYLSDDVLDILIKRKATKDFFEKVQTKKRIEIKNELGGDNPSIERITKVISEFVLEEFEKFTADKEDKENTPAATAEAPNEAPVTVDSEPTDSEGNDEDDDDNPTGGETSGSSESTPVNNEAPVTVETIKSQILNVSKRIVDEVSKNITLAEMKQRLQNELKEITEILAKIDFLNGKAE